MLSRRHQDLPLKTGYYVDKGAGRHCEHEDQSDPVERQRASDRGAEKQEQSKDRDRCERPAHACRKGRAVPAPDVAEHVAETQARGGDQHHPAQQLQSLVLPEQLYERDCRERSEEGRDRIRDDDAQLIELDRCPRLTATTKRVHEPGEACEAHRDAGNRKEERLVDHGREGNRSAATLAMGAGRPSWSPRDHSVAYDEEVSEVLCIDLSIVAEGERRVGRSECEAQELALLQGAIGIDRVEVAVLAIRVHDAVRVNRRRVDAPLKTAGVIVATLQVTEVVKPAAECIRVLELPLGRKIRVESRDVVRTGGRHRAEILVIAVRAGVVVVVLDHYRVSPVVAVDGRRLITAEVVCGNYGAFY